MVSKLNMFLSKFDPMSCVVAIVVGASATLVAIAAAPLFMGCATARNAVEQCVESSAEEAARKTVAWAALHCEDARCDGLEEEAIRNARNAVIGCLP